MRSSELHAFLDVLEKRAAAPLLRTNTLRAASAKLMGHDLRTVIPKPPSAGTFGVKTSQQYETMDAGKWKQTAKDLPLVIAAGGIGHGLGKTIGEQIGEAMIRRGVKVSPAAKAWAPLVLGGVSAAGGYMFGQSRARMRERREQASTAKAAGVEPAPQSRGIPRKKPSDPWRYDPRPAGEL